MSTSAGAAQVHALLIEDAPGDARLIREHLAAAPDQRIKLTWVDRLSKGIAQLDGMDVVLLDLSLPDSSGLDTFRRLKAEAPDLPVVVLSGLDDEEVALNAVHEGAQDYLVKGQVNGPILTRALRHAVERQRLDHARRDLERQKDEFFANVSHDLRTPLAAIKASISVVLANEPADMSAPLHRLLNNIDLAADQMGRMVDDLLELTRLRAGRVQLRFEQHDLRDLVREAAHALESLLERRAQRLEVDIPDEPVLAHVDADRVIRILANLLSNAHKYGRDGGVVRIGLCTADGEARCFVADDGPGIRAEDQERIFERFFRSDAHPASSRQEGSGLGLAIARALAERHGGSLRVESHPGAGATFWLTLPFSPREVTGKEPR